MTTVLAYYEGLLVNRHDEPILDGYRMIQIFGERNRVVVATSRYANTVEHQLKTERVFTLVAEVIDKTVDLPPTPLWQRQIEVARSRYLVSHVLTANPEIAQFVVERGMVSLFYGAPAAPPNQRPQLGNRSWEALIEELDARYDSSDPARS